MSIVRLPLWVVYAHPADYPGDMVARLWDGMTNTATPTVLRAPTLEELRRKLPPELDRLERLAADDPVIVEVWL